MITQLLALILVTASIGAGVRAERAAGAPVMNDQQTWNGTISDSQCGINHEGELNETDCTLRCIQLGFKYVLVSDGKILQIANQDFADLKPQAGKDVKVTGELKGDTITVSKIEKQAKPK